MLANRVRMGAGRKENTGPGPNRLIAGTMEEGFFGEVPASELFTGAEISSECGITLGTLQFSNVGWLKFAIDGEIIFKSKKTYRHSISYDHINSKGCVHGETQVSKNGINYKVTLMKGALTDPSNYSASDKGAHGSEWNRLMLPIHIKAKDKSWAFPDNVESDVPYWGIDFTDADLQVGSGNGRAHWCQEVGGADAYSRVYRGISGVSYSRFDYSTATSSHLGWSPVLRLV